MRDRAWEALSAEGLTVAPELEKLVAKKLTEGWQERLAAEVKVSEGKCLHCLDRDPTVRLTATDLDGTVLDMQEVCHECATKAGFEVGKAPEEPQQKPALPPPGAGSQGSYEWRRGLGKGPEGIAHAYRFPVREVTDNDKKVHALMTKHLGLTRSWDTAVCGVLIEGANRVDNAKKLCRRCLKLLGVHGLLVEPMKEPR